MAATSGTRRGNGCGKGQGWGGPAKGAGSDAPSFSDSLENRIGGVEPFDEQVRQSAAEREVMRKEQAEELKDELYRIGKHGLRESDRVPAITAFLNRVEGMPIARNVNLNTEMSNLTDEQLVEERARLAAQLDPGFGGAAGAVSAESPAGPADVGN